MARRTPGAGAAGARLVSGVLSNPRTFPPGGTLPGARAVPTPTPTPTPPPTRPPFTKDDEKAVHFYTTDAYRPLNNYLRDPSSVTDPAKRAEFDRQADWISQGLSHLPPDPGTTYRGTGRGPFLDRYKVGEVVEEPAFSSSSKDPGVAQGFAGPNGAIFKIDGKNGRYIEDYTDFPGEEEVAFDRGTRYEVTNRVEHGGRLFIDMKEQ
jgi:hypothetical protein